MSKLVFDELAEGQLMTADFAKKNKLFASPSFGTLYELESYTKYNPQSTNVFNTGADDTSRVYEVVSKFKDVEFISKEFTTNLTGEIILPAPGEGLQYVITYCAVRTTSTTGLAYFFDGGFKFGLCYFSNRADFAAGNIHITAGENRPIKLTSTQGAKEIYCALNYFIERIKQ